MLFSGLLFLLKKPHFILMLLPIYFQKLFHDNYSMWGIGDHYNIEFAPIMAIGVFIVISDFKKTKLVNGLAIGVLDRKSTRLNSSHVRISYAVFCLKKK